MIQKILITSIASLIFFTAFGQTDWKLAKEKDEIKVYTRKIADSQILECKAEVTVSASPTELLTVLKDVENHKKWIDRIKTSKSIKVVNEDEWLSYYEVSAPWPVSNRDVASRYKVITNTADKVIVNVTGESDAYPSQDGLVRIKKSTTLWTFIKIDNGSKVIYQSHSEPGGKLPDWLANSASTDNPFNTMKGLRNYVK